MNLKRIISKTSDYVGDLIILGFAVMILVGVWCLPLLMVFKTIAAWRGLS